MTCFNCVFGFGVSSANHGPYSVLCGSFLSHDALELVLQGVILIGTQQPIGMS